MRQLAKLDAGGNYILSNGLASHFHWTELQCRCGCGAKNMDQRTIDMIEAIRTMFGAPIRPNSGVRCFAYNNRIGGAKSSQHLPRTVDGIVVESRGGVMGGGRAVDFNVNGYTPRKVWSVCETEATALGIVGLGKYPSFTHADTRDGKKSRWEG